MTERRRAIVVGAEGGIGQAAARVLAADCDLGLTWWRDQAEVEATAEALRGAGARVETARLDLAEPASAAPVLEALVARLGGLDVLVASAGTNEPARVLDTDLAAFRRVVDVNLVGTTAVLLTAARLMVSAGRGGRLVAVTSVHEHLPLAASLAYTASKHALGGVVKSLAAELGPHAITVNSVAPGAIATRMTGREGIDARTSAYPVPAGRLGSPDEVAAVIGFLASPAASYVTGSSYGVDGGLALRVPPPGPPTTGRRVPWRTHPRH